ncbi:MAG: SAM-dependent methyltransferase [Oceanospirillales bacterium]|nr:SAM-dependent methyltransferase [Oceanospirillales bacterium]MBR9887967.1 SAM-dependent methyltransferase [Oceanospirillales bacterium]
MEKHYNAPVSNAHTGLSLKLSKRLKQIEQLVAPGYTHIWDCCCDHGLLGAALLSGKVARQIHFVDIVPELIAGLENRLQRFYPDSAAHWKTHCLDVARLPLEQYEGKQLIIIAGVGGDLIQQFIEAIDRQHSHLNVDFLLCPVHHQFALRQQLIELNFSLKDEILIEENQRFYEVILVSSQTAGNAPVSPVGSKIWQAVSAEQSLVVEKYLDKTLSHYRRIQQGNTTDVKHIIAAYQNVASTLC